MLANQRSFQFKFSNRNKFAENQKQELQMAAMFVNGSGRNEYSYRKPSIDAYCQVSIHLSKRFQRRRFKCKRLTDRRRTSSDDKISHGLWTGFLKK